MLEVVEVMEVEVMGDNEGHVLPGTMRLVLREDVYIGACEGKGRDRFTAAHVYVVIERMRLVATPSAASERRSDRVFRERSSGEPGFV